MSNNAPRNRGVVDQTLRAIRRTGNPGQLSSHTNDAGTPVTSAGNNEAPYAWSPPFQEALQAWASQTLTAEAVALNPVDLDDFRVVSVLIQYTPLSDTSQLVVMPMVGGNVDGDQFAQQLPNILSPPMFPMGFTRGDVTVVTGPGPAPLDAQFAARSILPAMFRTPAGLGNVPQQFTLDFEASSYKRFTLAVAESGVSEGEFGRVSISWARRT